jgi:hypothetical protein
MKLGEIRVKDFLDRTGGAVRGRLISDAKIRAYSADYTYTEDADGLLHITRTGSRSEVVMKPVIDLDEALVCFFGFYSGDGAKGGERPDNPGVVRPPLSISQSEPNLIRFSVEQFRKVFESSIHFEFSLGEDSAYFMAGEGLSELKTHYGGVLPPNEPLKRVRPTPDARDQKYLAERRPVAGDNETHLAFYYQHKDAMAEILTLRKRKDIARAGIVLTVSDNITASLRKPFKKGARQPGGSSRADETRVGGVTGCGELFLKILHEIESSIQENTQKSTQGLIIWSNTPSEVGELINLQDFFTNHPFGTIGGERPVFSAPTLPASSVAGTNIIGRWPRSKNIVLESGIRIDPLWCYTSGLYLAEGKTDKADILAMPRQRIPSPSFSFTSSENTSLELLLRALQKLFRPEDCVTTWKVKVGSQYFPELVVIGLKNAVPMLRGGASGDGKIRTIEISIEIKDWALAVAPCMQPYADKYSHVEPTGAGVARIDVSASPTLCRWFFPLLLYAAFGATVTDPATELC